MLIADGSLSAALATRIMAHQCRKGPSTLYRRDVWSAWDVS
jgi:hypothetical protein